MSKNIIKYAMLLGGLLLATSSSNAQAQEQQAEPPRVGSFEAPTDCFPERPRSCLEGNYRDCLQPRCYDRLGCERGPEAGCCPLPYPDETWYEHLPREL
ncbi:MAG: hypothetical protein QM778_18510 [Myxococcales bacterium]